MKAIINFQINKNKSVDEESLLTVNVQNRSNPYINKESNIIKNKIKLKMKKTINKSEFNPKNIDLGKIYNIIYKQITLFIKYTNLSSILLL
jgi:hypothetical protein